MILEIPEILLLVSRADSSDWCRTFPWGLIDSISIWKLNISIQMSLAGQCIVVHCADQSLNIHETDTTFSSQISRHSSNTPRILSRFYQVPGGLFIAPPPIFFTLFVCGTLTFAVKLSEILRSVHCTKLIQIKSNHFYWGFSHGPRELVDKFDHRWRKILYDETKIRWINGSFYLFIICNNVL